MNTRSVTIRKELSIYSELLSWLFVIIGLIATFFGPEKGLMGSVMAGFGVSVIFHVISESHHGKTLFYLSLPVAIASAMHFDEYLVMPCWLIGFAIFLGIRKVYLYYENLGSWEDF